MVKPHVMCQLRTLIGVCDLVNDDRSVTHSPELLYPYQHNEQACFVTLFIVSWFW